MWVCGCASLPPGKRDPHDPWERMNRATYKFNDKFDHWIARPTARAYQKFVPHFVQTGFRHFIDNIDYPDVMVNDLLQGQLKPFASDTMRFVVNTTLGIGGVFDPATRMGFEKNDRDLGQTFGKWGVPKGPYIVVPFLGPYDLRDGVGSIGDVYLKPKQYLFDSWTNYGLWLGDKIDLRARFLPTDRIVDNSYDPYAFIRNAYLQNRDFKVKGAQSETEQQSEELLLEEGESEAAPPANAPKPASAPAPAPAPPTPEPQR